MVLPGHARFQLDQDERDVVVLGAVGVPAHRRQHRLDRVVEIGQ
ncbi:hypothetical protein [Streptomyces sp. Ac-502]